MVKNKNKAQSSHKGYKLPTLLFLQRYSTTDYTFSEDKLIDDDAKTGVKLVIVHSTWTAKNSSNIISQSYTEKEIFFPKKQSTASYNASNYRMYSYSISLVVFL